ncbi:MAG: hypothetical protein COS29_04005 [Candidatus Omnitrophica bacterium CG02_land_8_20_14_3_00__42_8]|nr:MAG: hypothetical protein COS29_04005 [Candidatus Omnitrophica bacterium CG02_land_8_20_14_3_00__42_8]PIW68662.1 MAG: hypothetical protein COW10_01335 [Candidatus Omnitrophica bacterium CG12_big_fil_rev_8_21_14_0_65_42_8]
MRKGYIGVLASTSEQILYRDLIDTEKNKSYEYEICDQRYEIDQVQQLDTGNFMLERPEPIKETPKFGSFRLGKIKGTLKRKNLYEDR